MKSETSSFKAIINEFDFLKKTGIIQWNAWKKDLMLLANKLIERISDPRNAKEYYQSFIRKKTQNQWKNKKQLLINQILLKTQALLI